MTTTMQKEMIKKAYPSSKNWARRVDQMSESQVCAIYLRLKREGKI